MEIFGLLFRYFLKIKVVQVYFEYNLIEVSINNILNYFNLSTININA